MADAPTQVERSEGTNHLHSVSLATSRTDGAQDSRRDPDRRRYVALDGLRGIAAFAIVFFHIHWSNHLTGSNAVRHVFLVVDLFFMLSGFVLAASYLERIRDSIDLRRFFVLRFFRIYPLHLAMLILMMALELVRAGAASIRLLALGRAPFATPNSLQDLAFNLFLFQSIATTTSWNVPSWSISCEAASYIVFGFAILTGVLGSRVFHIMAVPTAIVAYVVVLCCNGNLNATDSFGILRCLAGFALGAWAFNVTRVTRISTLPPGTLNILCLGLVVWLIAALCFVDGTSELLVLPAFLLLLLFLHQDVGTVAKLLCGRSIQFLGLISFSIYMVHFPILTLMEMVVKKFVPSHQGRLGELSLDPWIGDGLLLMAGALVLLVASLTFSRIERPWREYGRSLAVARKPAMPAKSSTA